MSGAGDRPLWCTWKHERIKEGENGHLDIVFPACFLVFVRLRSIGLN